MFIKFPLWQALEFAECVPGGHIYFECWVCVGHKLNEGSITDVCRVFSVPGGDRTTRLAYVNSGADCAMQITFRPTYTIFCQIHRPHYATLDNSRVHGLRCATCPKVCVGQYGHSKIAQFNWECTGRITCWKVCTFLQGMIKRRGQPWQQRILHDFRIKHMC
jgi:hypothetical protein